MSSQLFMVSHTTTQRPILTIRFDDGITDGVAIASQFRLVGSIYVITDRMNVTTLQDAQDQGWSIEAHTCSHPDLTTLDLTQLQYEIGHCQQVLESYGFHPQVFAYPHSKYNDQVLDVVQQYYNYATDGWTKHESRYTINALYVTQYTAINDLIADVTTSLKTRTVTTIMFHHLKPIAEHESDWTLAQYTQFCVYVAELVHTGQCVVLTAPEAYARVFNS